MKRSIFAADGKGKENMWPKGQEDKNAFEFDTSTLQNAIKSWNRIEEFFKASPLDLKIRYAKFLDTFVQFRQQTQGIVVTEIQQLQKAQLLALVTLEIARGHHWQKRDGQAKLELDFLATLLPLLDQSVLPAFQGQYNMLRGMNYLELKDVHLAEQFFSAAKKQFDDEKNFKEAANCYYYLGLTAMAFNNFKAADENFKWVIANLEPNPLLHANCLRKQAICCVMLDEAKPEDALTYSQQAIKMYAALGSAKNIQNSIQQLKLIQGSIYLSRGELAAAENVMDKHLQIYLQTLNDDDQIALKQLLPRLFKAEVVEQLRFHREPFSQAIIQAYGDLMHQGPSIRSGH